MILYFDSYITDIPLNKNTGTCIDSVRGACNSYTMPTKIDIAKYTLASYSQYDWSHVFIKYEVDNVDDYDIMDGYILDLFPDAIIIHNRSENFNSFQESLEVVNSFNDNWIFYAGNNDQPWVGADASYVDDLVMLASGFENEFNYVSIPYTHYSEFLNLNVKNTPINLLYGRDIVNIKEDDNAKIILRGQGDNTSAQIVNKNLLNFWFSTKIYPDRRIIRSEDVRNLFLTKDQIMVIPKKEICAHFDGYVHTLGKASEISNHQVPPLLIPNGFFSSTIKIRYGYSEYKEGWLNINPANDQYIFESVSGTDLKIDIGEVPCFWSEKISEIDINSNADIGILRDATIKNNRVIRSPWRVASKRFLIGSVFFYIRYLILFIFVRSGLVKIIFDKNERRNYLKSIYSLLRRYKIKE